MVWFDLIWTGRRAGERAERDPKAKHSYFLGPLSSGVLMMAVFLAPGLVTWKKTRSQTKNKGAALLEEQQSQKTRGNRISR